MPKVSNKKDWNGFPAPGPLAVRGRTGKAECPCDGALLGTDSLGPGARVVLSEAGK